MTRLFPYTVAAALLAALLIACVPAIDPQLLSLLAAAPDGVGGLLFAGAIPGFYEQKSLGDDDDVTMGDIARQVGEQGVQWEAFSLKHETEQSAMKQQLRDLQLKAGRQGLGLGGAPGPISSAETWIDTKTRARVPVLRHEESLAALDNKTSDVPSFGRVLRGLVVGGHAADAKALHDERKALGITPDPSGGYTVQGALSSEWIDLLRANMVLSRAGARTVPMDSTSLTLAKLTGDPTVAWNNESADITGVDATFGAATLTAKTCVCLVKMSLELSQDSANIEQILQAALVGSMSNAIDSAGLVGVTTNAGVAPNGVFNLSGRNIVAAIGAPTSWDFLVDGMYELAADNVPMESIGAMIAHPALWKKMRKLKTGIASDNTSLTMPEELAKLPKLWTTAAPLAGGTTAKAVIADWRDLLFGVRKSITVRVLQDTFMGSNLQVAVLAYARVDFAATRHQSFCTMEGITV